MKNHYFGVNLEALLIALILVIYLMPAKVTASDFEGVNQEQPITVTGTIISGVDQEPLPGVTIMVQGTTHGTVSDPEGQYSITVDDPEAILVFSSVGYETQEISIDNREVIDVTMVEDVTELGEVIALGYRSQQGTELGEVIALGYRSQQGATISGSVSNVDVANLERRRVSDVAQALQGQVAGVQITQSTGAPGDETEVRIRGTSTIGNNNPLYVVDGLPTRDISFLNPSDIESMTVMKDAASTAIYGSRASGGVIVVSLKSGLETEGLEVNYYAGAQRATNLPTMLNSSQYLGVLEQAWNNAGFDGANPYTADMNRTDFADTNWLDELLETGTMQSVHILSQGGTENTRYTVSGGYYGQDGIFYSDNDRLQRFNFRTQIHSDVTDRLTLGANPQISYRVHDRVSSRGTAPGIIRHAFLRPPIISVFKDPSDPTYSVDDPYTDLPFYRGPDDHEANKYELSQNPIALAAFTDDRLSNVKTFGSIYGEYSLLSDHSLMVRSSLGADINFFHAKAFNRNFGDDDGGGAEQDSGLGRQNRPSNLSESRGQDITITWNNTLHFDRASENHDISAIVGNEFITNSSSDIGASRQRFDFIDSNLRYLDLGGSEENLWNSGLGEEWALLSFFGSATYVNQDRYMATVTLRADASSRFAEDNRWGYFPAFSAGWMISEEDFMQPIELISEMKLRASWGQQGNQEIPTYAFQTLYRSDADRVLINRYGNPDLRWETTTQANVGLDFGLFRNRLYVSMDYFEKVTSDILLPISLPQLAGDVEATFVNAGQVSNNGFELSVTYRNYDNPFGYFISGNMAAISNTVDELHPNLPNIIGSVTRTQPGHPLNAYFGYVQEGIYQNQAEIDEHLFNTPNPSQQPGDIRFRDLDESGVIDDNDRTVIGDPNPDFTFGLNFGGSYSSFDISFFFQGVYGVDRFNDLKRIIDYDTRPFNYSDRVLDSWDGEGSTNSIPRVSFTDNGSSRVSDIYVEDASYLRLKNMEIGYNFNLGRGEGGNIRLYLSGQNLLTFTNYTGLDPESTDLMDRGTYPQARTVLLGINTSF